LRIDEDGWLPLVRAAYDDEKLTNNTFIQSCKIADWIYLSDEVLSTVEPAILKAICYGDVHAACKGNNYLRPIVESYEKRSDEQATIYLRQMTVGLRDEALTIAQARDLALIARQYANQVDSQNAKDQAAVIDKAALLPLKWCNAYTDAGRRHFIEDSKGNVDTGKKRTLLTFSRTLFRLAQQAEDEGKAHIPFLQYVGYAIKGSQRRKQHDALTGTSSLFLFTKFAIESWKGSPTVHMHNFTICLITEEVVGPVAEMLLTRLARAYYFAGGFSVSHAGASMSSLSLINLDKGEREKVWDKNTKHAKTYTNYNSIQSKESASRKRLRKAEYEAKVLAQRDEIAKFEGELQTKRDDLDKLRARADLEQWEQDFPELFQQYKDFEKYVSDTTRALADQAQG
jgi:hypothetical protein